MLTLLIALLVFTSMALPSARFLVGPSDDKGDDDKGDDTGDDKGNEAPTAEQLAAENAELKATLAEASKRLDKIDAKDKDDKDARKKQEEQDAIDKGNAQKIIDEKDTTISSMDTRLKSYEERDQKRADEIFKALPEEVQKAITPYQEKLAGGDWLDFITTQSNLHGSTANEVGGVPPVITPGGDRMPRKGNKHLPSAKATMILDDELGKGDDMLKELITNKDPESAAVKFTMPIRDFFKRMNKTPTVRLTAKK